MDDLDRLARDIVSCNDLERVPRNVRDEPWKGHVAVGRDIGCAILQCARARRLMPRVGWAR